MVSFFGQKISHGLCLWLAFVVLFETIQVILKHFIFRCKLTKELDQLSKHLQRGFSFHLFYFLRLDLRIERQHMLYYSTKTTFFFFFLGAEKSHYSGGVQF